MPHDPEALSRLYAGLPTETALFRAILKDFRGRIALVSSFGAESAALLALVAEADPATPVLFNETGMLFPETLAYQQDLAERLGLSDVRLIRPDPAALARADPAGRLHESDPESCCALRKVAPLAAALDGFAVWITGRKRHQARTRAAMTLFEADGPDRLKFNPLAYWSADRVRAFMQERHLPPHPLVAKGFPSIGCQPCTSAARPDEDPRAGRWRGRDKTECGIHYIDGKPARSATPAQF